MSGHSGLHPQGAPDNLEMVAGNSQCEDVAVDMCAEFDTAVEALPTNVPIKDALSTAQMTHEVSSFLPAPVSMGESRSQSGTGGVYPQGDVSDCHRNMVVSSEGDLAESGEESVDRPDATLEFDSLLTSTGDGCFDNQVRMNNMLDYEIASSQTSPPLSPGDSTFSFNEPQPAALEVTNQYKSFLHDAHRFYQSTVERIATLEQDNELLRLKEKKLHQEVLDLRERVEQMRSSEQGVTPKDDDRVRLEGTAILLQEMEELRVKEKDLLRQVKELKDENQLLRIGGPGPFARPNHVETDKEVRLLHPELNHCRVVNGKHALPFHGSEALCAWGCTHSCLSENTVVPDTLPCLRGLASFHSSCTRTIVPKRSGEEDAAVCGTGTASRCLNGARDLSCGGMKDRGEYSDQLNDVGQSGGVPHGLRADEDSCDGGPSENGRRVPKLVRNSCVRGMSVGAGGQNGLRLNVDALIQAVSKDSLSPINGDFAIHQQLSVKDPVCKDPAETLTRVSPALS